MATYTYSTKQSEQIECFYRGEDGDAVVSDLQSLLKIDEFIGGIDLPDSIIEALQVINDTYICGHFKYSMFGLAENLCRVALEMILCERLLSYYNNNIPIVPRSDSIDHIEIVDPHKVEKKLKDKRVRSEICLRTYDCRNYEGLINWALGERLLPDTQSERHLLHGFMREMRNLFAHDFMISTITPGQASRTINEFLEVIGTLWGKVPIEKSELTTQKLRAIVWNESGHQTKVLDDPEELRLIPEEWNQCVLAYINLIPNPLRRDSWDNKYRSRFVEPQTNVVSKDEALSQYHDMAAHQRSYSKRQFFLVESRDDFGAAIFPLWFYHFVEREIERFDVIKADEPDTVFYHLVHCHRKWLTPTTSTRGRKNSPCSDQKRVTRTRHCDGCNAEIVEFGEKPSERKEFKDELEKLDVVIPQPPPFYGVLPEDVMSIQWLIQGWRPSTPNNDSHS